MSTSQNNAFKGLLKLISFINEVKTYKLMTLPLFLKTNLYVTVNPNTTAHVFLRLNKLQLSNNISSPAFSIKLHQSEICKLSTSSQKL